MLSELTSKDQDKGKKVVGSAKKENQLASSHEELQRPEALTSEVMSVLTRIDIAGCSRLFSGIFGDKGLDRPQFRDSSKEYNSKVQIAVASVLAKLSEDKREAIMGFFFEDPDPEESVDVEVVQKALRMIRHPTRSESLRKFLYRVPDQ
ncbi:MAG: hypothetical protein HND55_13540 [Pseudomonadota bacterium]|nr:MAG: hypothetical protein HND55_13540 [Pseudomonadota bacterium]